jgi:hypothetical protein
VLGNPLKYTDPSGHDPLDAAWEQEFELYHGRPPTDEDRQDRLFSLMFAGTGTNGAWTDKDWQFYANNRARLWSGGERWLVHEAEGLDRFLNHMSRMAAHYNRGEEGLFARAVGLVWGGIEYSGSGLVALTQAGGGRHLAQMHEGRLGWNSKLVDVNDPAHHFAGAFLGGWLLEGAGGVWTNAAREVVQWAVTGTGTKQDILLGNRAASHAALFRRSAQGVFHKSDPYSALIVRLDRALR